MAELTAEELAKFRDDMNYNRGLLSTWPSVKEEMIANSADLRKMGLGTVADQLIELASNAMDKIISGTERTALLLDEITRLTAERDAEEGFRVAQERRIWERLARARSTKREIMQAEEEIGSLKHPTPEATNEKES